MQNQKFDIQRLKQKTMRKYPSFASVLASVDLVEIQGLKTAGTDNDNIFYDPEWMATLTDDEQVFIFAHEMFHIALNHIPLSEGKDPNIWNIATDATINQLLLKDGLPMYERVVLDDNGNPKLDDNGEPIISRGVNMPEGRTHDAVELYEKLLREKEAEKKPNRGNKGDDQDPNQQDGQNSDQKQGQQSQGQDQQGNQQNQSNNGQEQSGENQNQQDGGQPSQKQDQQQNGQQGQGQQPKEPFQNAGHDLHDLWEEGLKRHKERQKELENAGIDDPIKQRQEKQKELSEMGEHEAFERNKQEKRQQLDELMNALASTPQGAGTEAGGERLTTSAIGAGKPLIDWRHLLREAVQNDADWSYRNAEIEDGVLTAKLEEYPIPESEIVLDTSGSINHTLLRNFLRECKHILANSRVKVGCFDTKFYGFNEIRSEKEIDAFPLQGGGGTDFDVAVAAFTKRVENKIIFTDGDARMPKEAIDAIWVVFGEEKIQPKGGRVIQINREQLRRLMRFQQQEEQQFNTGQDKGLER